MTNHERGKNAPFSTTYQSEAKHEFNVGKSPVAAAPLTSTLPSESRTDSPLNSDTGGRSGASGDAMGTESKQGEPAAKVPHFITEARPQRVPPALLALAPDARVSEEHRIGRSRGASMGYSASDYRETIEATMARQAEDFFTLNEAAQVLADARGLDPIAMVHRLRRAQDEGELVIRDCATRLGQGKGDTKRDFLDLVKGADIDAWLTVSGVGYGFPKADGAAVPPRAARAVTAQEPRPERGRPVKPPQVLPAQEAEILKAIRQMGLVPKQLPPRQAGKPWVKSAVWGEIGVCQLFASERVFNKAWDRLRSSTEIAERPGL